MAGFVTFISPYEKLISKIKTKVKENHFSRRKTLAHHPLAAYILNNNNNWIEVHLT